MGSPNQPVTPTMQPARVLAATDFSPAAETALQWAAVLAQRFEAELVVLNVIDLSFLLVPSLPSSGPVIAPDYDVLHSFREEAKRQMELIRQRYPYARTEIREGSPRPVILEASTELKADLIVIGTHGRSGLAHLLMGSVAEHVIRHSKIPVLTIPIGREG